MDKVSILIPARNEFLLRPTIESVLSAAKGDIEVIAVLDGYWPEPNIIDDPRVILVHHTEPIGQRAAINEAAGIATGKYILKTDGHSMFDEGFDVKLSADCEYDWTVLPRMYNLHAFDWVCENGHKFYQDKYRPEGGECKDCGKPVQREMVWKPRLHRRTDYMRFGNDLVVKYWKAYEKRPEAQGDITDVMNGVGACWFMHKDRFWELGGMDEKHGSWGQVGVEVALKAWLSGGRHVVNKKTWFAHMFRTTGEFSFPYTIKGKDQDKAREYSKDLWMNNKWHLQKRPFDWVLNKFHPIPTWPKEKPKVSELAPKPEVRPLVSVIIPARNEIYLQRTIDDLLEKLQTGFEIVVGLDGYKPELKEDPRVVLCHSKERIGMRPIINKAVGMARGKYIMRLDAHCVVDDGIDTKLIECYKKGDTVLAMRYELDSKKWARRDRTDCPYRYLSRPDTDPKGGLRGLAWPEWAEDHKDEDIGETMTVSGSNWLMEREQFLEWGGLDEEHGTFGQEGAEISCKTWLSGGRVLVNKKTWYAHWNRGKTCYTLGPNQKKKSMKRSIELWMDDKWPLAKRKFQWLIDHFSPVPGWGTDTTILMYTDGRVPKKVFKEVLRTVESAGKPLIIVSQRPVVTTGKNIVVGDIPRNFLSIYKQIDAGLKDINSKYVVLAEHDILYAPGYFDFIPPKDDVLYYNDNRWILHSADRIFSRNSKNALSQLFCSTELLRAVVSERLKTLSNSVLEGRFIVSDGVKSKLKEPGFEKDSKYKYAFYTALKPNIDICHGQNFLAKKRINKERASHLEEWGEAPILTRRLGLKNPVVYRYRPCFRTRKSSVNEMFDNFVKYADPNKRSPDNPRGVYEFQKTFNPFVKSILAGEKYTDEELKSLPYFWYLAKHLVKLPDYSDYKPTANGIRHVIRKMRDAENLCNSIKKDGLKAPLDIFKYKGGRLLIRGQRRVVVLKQLGHKTVPVRVFFSQDDYRRRKKLLDFRGGGKTEKAGIDQFARLGRDATDKYFAHNYLPLYDRHLVNKRDPKKILEIGVKRGASLLLWKSVFPKAQIYGVDKKDRTKQVLLKGQKNITLFTGDQSDRSFLSKVAEAGPFDLIIDDGSHNPDHQLLTFDFFWPLLPKNGIYVIEDLWGQPKWKHNRGFVMDRLKETIDDICFTGQTKSVSFHPNIVFIQKNG